MAPGDGAVRRVQVVSRICFGCQRVANRCDHAHQLQVRDDALDEFVIAKQHLRVAAGGDDQRVGAVAICVLLGQVPHHAANAMEYSLEHGLGGVLAEGLLQGGLEGDLRERCGATVERGELHRCARRDGSAMEGPLAIDEVDRDGGARIDDDAGLLDGLPRASGAEEAIDARERLGIEVAADGHRQVIADAPDVLGDLVLEARCDCRCRLLVDRCEHDGRTRFPGGLRGHGRPSLERRVDDRRGVARIAADTGLHLPIADSGDGSVGVSNRDCQEGGALAHEGMVVGETIEANLAAGPVVFFAAMGATLIDGRALAATVRKDLSARVATLAEGGQGVRLDAVLVEGDDAAAIYATRQEKATAEVGIAYSLHRLSASATQEEIEAVIDGLNADDDVTAIMVHLPLPDGVDTDAIQSRIAAGEDGEGVNPVNIGSVVFGRRSLVPCTALAAMEMIESTGIDLKGADCVCVGASTIVGKPMAVLLMRAEATVTSTNVHTRDQARLTREADVLICAAGVAGLITADMVKEGAVVIDIGINRVNGADGKARTVGDVDFEGVSAVAGYISPVPGGVGPMTVAMLLRNTVDAAEG